MSKATVVIVTWNSERNLKETLASLNDQTWTDFDVVVVDNASTDGTVDVVRSERPTAMLLRNTKNRGYGRAFNQAMSYVQAHLAEGRPDYFLITISAGVTLEPDSLRTLIDAIDRQPEIGSATGPLYRAWRDWEDETNQIVRSDVVESAGLRLLRSGRVVARDAGLSDDGSRYRRREDIFGVSGAYGVYRFGALGEAMVGSVLLDESYLMGQEHEDLAWRLRVLGWPSVFVPLARAWRIGDQAEAGAGVTLVSDFRCSTPSAVLTRKTYGNQILTVLKNAYLRNLLLDLPWSMASLTGRSAYLLFRRPRALHQAWVDVFRSFPGVMVQRNRLMRRSQSRPASFRNWYTVEKKK